MIIAAKTRSTEPEIMDAQSLKERELQLVLEDLTTVNTLLGGNRVTIQGIEKLLEGVSKEAEISIADIGCGNGTVMKEIANWGRENGYQFKLFGIDNNERSIKIAQAECIEYREIEFYSIDVLDPVYEKYKFDVITSTLTLHHFTDEEIIKLLQRFMQQCRYGLVINDLERNMTAYYLFKLFASVFFKTKIAKADGLTSILRGFKRDELLKYGEKVGIEKQLIKWCWAFRYQWIIYKNENTDNPNQ